VGVAWLDADDGKGISLQVPLAGKATARKSATISLFQGSEKASALLNGK